MPKTYTTLSLDADLEASLQRIGEQCLAPLGVTVTNPAVLRHLIKYHTFVSGEQAKKQHEAMMSWKEGENE